MAIEPRIKRDPSRKCPICGGDTELVSITFTHRDGEMQQVEVTSPRRRCANLKCKGHGDGLDKLRRSLAGPDTRSVQEGIVIEALKDFPVNVAVFACHE